MALHRRGRRGLGQSRSVTPTRHFPPPSGGGGRGGVVGEGAVAAAAGASTPRATHSLPALPGEGG